MAHQRRLRDVQDLRALLRADFRCFDEYPPMGDAALSFPVKGVYGTRMTCTLTSSDLEWRGPDFELLVLSRPPLVCVRRIRKEAVV